MQKKFILGFVLFLLGSNFSFAARSSKSLFSGLIYCEAFGFDFDWQGHFVNGLGRISQEAAAQSSIDVCHLQGLMGCTVHRCDVGEE